MKPENFITFFAGVLTMSLVSCNGNLSNPEYVSTADALGTIRVDLKMKSSDDIKAGSSYTEVKDYESVFNSVQILIFDKDGGKLEKYLLLDDGASTANLSVPVGEKTVWAVANYSSLESTKTESDLKDIVLGITDNPLDASKGFVLAGSSTATIQAGATEDCTVKVSRFLARVALTSVTNSIPSAYTVELKWACLTNVVGHYSFGDVQGTDLWCNPMCRCAETPVVSSHIINGQLYKASPEAYTFATLSGTDPFLFYAFPNSSATDPSGFSASFSGQKTVLVIAATLNGELMYYPVVLDGLERNTAYTVNVTLLGPGSSDPNLPVVKSSVAVSVQAEPWIDGGVIDSEI